MTGSGITIGQLADHAGVSVRAVRHYHSLGLLPEPERDHSGYRRYDATAMVDLIRIKTLAGAGVPLARVAELLAADEATFADALTDIDRDLRCQVAELQRRRREVAALETPERLALPESVVAYLDRLREMGGSEAGLAVERDLWMIIAVHRPDLVDQWIADKTATLDDDLWVKFVLMFDEAREWTVDDPRLAHIADQLVEFFEELWAGFGPDGPPDVDGMPDDELVAVMDEHVFAGSPAWQRIADLVRERGWEGWTGEVRRVAPR